MKNHGILSKNQKNHEILSKNHKPGALAVDVAADRHGAPDGRVGLLECSPRSVVHRSALEVRSVL